MDEGHEHSPEESDDQFVSIVNHSLADVDPRPTRLKVLDWAIVVAIVVGLGLVVGAMLGLCVWIWLVVAGKF